MNEGAATPRRRRPSAAAWRGAARLATEATAGLVDLVEAVHAGIARVPIVASAPADGRTRGITGLVYRTVRGVTRLVGGGVDALLGLLAVELAEDEAARADSAPRDALQAALNGVLGDHLEASGNPLAITMALRHEGQVVMLGSTALAARLPRARPALALMLHGLCMHDRSWRRGLVDGEPDLAETLARAGFTPLALHYNTGRPIARNGQDLAAMLEALVAAWPVPVERLVIVGHSMGGLVARSALHQALHQAPHQALHPADDATRHLPQPAGTPHPARPWPALLSDLVCVGTPHQGAPLEQLGHAVTSALAATPYAAPFARLARLRSAGITDLRHGAVLGDPKQAAPLPAGLRAYAVAGTLGETDGALHKRFVGDGLVPLASALGRHADPARDLHFPEQRVAVFGRLGHLTLMSHPLVLAQIGAWLAPPAGPGQSATASR